MRHLPLTYDVTITDDVAFRWRRRLFPFLPAFHFFPGLRMFEFVLASDVVLDVGGVLQNVDDAIGERLNVERALHQCLLQRLLHSLDDERFFVTDVDDVPGETSLRATEVLSIEERRQTRGQTVTTLHNARI